MLAAFYVVTHHSVEWGGLHGSVQPGTLPYLVISFVSIWVYCMVDIFMLISGYAGFQEKDFKPDYSKTIALWIEITFYCVIISFIYVLIKPDRVAARDIWDMLFPLTDNLYWFFSAYIGLCLVKPLLDTAIRNTGKEQILPIMTILFMAFSVYNLIADPFLLGKGYTFIWIFILYLFGAAMKKCGIGENTARWKAVLGMILCALISWAWMNFGPEFVFVNRRYGSDLFFSYTSPTMLGMAVFHVILFSKFRFPEKVNKAIAFLAPGSFAVYLMNTHRCVWFYSLEKCFAGWASRPLWAVPKVLLFSAFFALGGMLIDSQRQRLFRKLKVRQSIYELLYGPRRMNALLRLASPAYIIAFFLIWSVLFWKCKYGYAGAQETLAAAVPFRFLRQGESLFVHEQYVRQMSSVLLLPLLKIYFAFIHSTEGILLNLRLIYTFLWGCAAAFFYFRLRRFSNIGAILASLAFLMYSPYCLPAFSGDSLLVLTLANAGIIFLTAEKYAKIQYFIAGMFLGCAVICCPYLIIPCLIFSLTVLLLRKKRREFAGKWLFVCMGSCLTAGMILVMFLTQSDGQTIPEKFAVIFGTADFQIHSVLQQTGRFILGFIRSSKSAPFILSGTAIAVLISMIWKKTKEWCFIAVCVLCAVWMFDFRRTFRDINSLMVPICVLGLYCLPHTKDTKTRGIFLTLFVPGVISAYCRMFSPDRGFYTAANAMAVSAAAGVFMIVNFVKGFSPQPSRNRMRAALLAAAFLFFTVQLGSELFLRYTCNAYESGIDEQLSHARSGPQKGIRMTPEKLETYNAIIEKSPAVLQDAEDLLFLVREP